MAMTVKSSNGKLVVEIDINKNPAPSGSGKTLVVASSHGNQATELQINGRVLFVGLNAYIKPA